MSTWTNETTGTKQPYNSQANSLRPVRFAIVAVRTAMTKRVTAKSPPNTVLIGSLTISSLPALRVSV